MSSGILIYSLVEILQYKCCRTEADSEFYPIPSSFHLPHLNKSCFLSTLCTQDFSCVLLFGACIEGVVLRDK